MANGKEKIITEEDIMAAFDRKCEKVESVVFEMAMSGEDPKDPKDQKLIDWANNLKAQTEVLTREEFDALVLKEGKVALEEEQKDKVKSKIEKVRESSIENTKEVNRCNP